MSEHFQPGQHPDADRLSAFADNALPAHEREETLAHLAQCDDCRSVVFLAQEAVTEDQVAPELAPAARPVQKARFAGWRLAWRTAAVFACLVVAGVYGHHLWVRGNNGAGTSIAANPSTQVESAVGRQPLPATEPARPSDLRSSDKGAAVVPEERKRSTPSYAVHGTVVETLPLSGRDVSDLSMQQKTLTSTSSKGAIGTSTGGGRIQEKAAAGYTGSTGAGQVADFNHVVGGAAKPNAAPTLPQVDASASAMFTAPAAAPAAAASPALRRAPAQLASGGPVAVRPAIQAREMATLNAQSIVNDSSLKQTSPAPVQFQLPSHLQTVSSISNARLILAIDSGGTLFASRDAGNHWKSISPRWTGHAVKVNFAPDASLGPMQAPAPPKMKSSSAPAAAPASVPAPAAPQDSIQNAPLAPAAMTSPSLTGVVTDLTGAVIANATITATNAATAQSITARTDGGGRYGFGNLEPGTYTVTARSPGFNAQTLNGIEVAASQAVVRNIALNVGASTQTVTVEADNRSVQTESTNLSVQLEDQEIAKAHPAVFELTTETGEIWTSADGRHWKRK